MGELSREQLRKLVERYINGSATASERKVLESYYDLFSLTSDVTELLESAQLDILETRIKQNITDRIVREKSRKISLTLLTRVAAAVAVFAGFGWLLFLKPQEQTAITAAKIAEPQMIQSIADKPVNRYLTLPDGSIVILHKGSNIQLTDNFNKTNRKLILSGEAYFDIARNANLPFIIETGNLKTTVLGTAFTVKAWPNDTRITVTVSRGEVQVEDKSGVLAVLTPEENLSYDVENSKIESSENSQKAEPTWLEEEMTFEEIPFGELVERLSLRYATPISFNNSDLKNCQITGRFSGTETLSEVLRTLTLTSNTRFVDTGNGIIIDGEDCQ